MRRLDEDERPVRNSSVTVRIVAQELGELESAAESQGTTVSALIREAVRSKLAGMGSPVVLVMGDQVIELEGSAILGPFTSAQDQDVLHSSIRQDAVFGSSQSPRLAIA